MSMKMAVLSDEEADLIQLARGSKGTGFVLL